MPILPDPLNPRCNDCGSPYPVTEQNLALRTDLDQVAVEIATIRDCGPLCDACLVLRSFVLPQREREPFDEYAVRVLDWRLLRETARAVRRVQFSWGTTDAHRCDLCERVEDAIRTARTGYKGKLKLGDIAVAMQPRVSDRWLRHLNGAHCNEYGVYLPLPKGTYRSKSSA